MSAAPVVVIDVLEGPLVGRRFELAGRRTFVVGRGPEGVDAALEDSRVSKVHFQIETDPPLMRLRDLLSTNGTYVQGERTTETQACGQATVQAGATKLLVRLWSASEGPMTRAPGCSAGEEAQANFGDYVLLEELGEGGMGVVHRARRKGDDRPVAVKRVRPELTAKSETLHRFQREIAVLRSLDHPRIVRLLDAGEMQGQLFLVMELVDGHSADRVVRERGPMSAGEVVELGCQLLEALGHAHERGLIHRDVKPGNLLLERPAAGGGGTTTGLKLTDFGLARAYGNACADPGQKVNLALTRKGDFVGTLAFMSPEQALDAQGATPASDQFSAAAALYYLHAGQYLYEAPTLPELQRCVLNGDPCRDSAGLRELPGPLGDVLRRALERDPRRRYECVARMCEDLRRAA